MNRNLILIILVVVVGLFAFNSSQSAVRLEALEFQKTIKSYPNAPIIDVRTPEEFANGHLKKAKNINWNDANFKPLIGKLDRKNPVFIYCHSGGRSQSAAKTMHSLGFVSVYELKGGFSSWLDHNLPH